MPVLTQPDYRDLRRALFQDAETKAELKALANLPSETQLLRALQVIEDDFTAFRSALRAKIATEFGLPTTNALPVKLNRRMLAHYCAWKMASIFKE